MIGSIKILAKESLKGMIALGVWLVFCYFCDFSFGFFLGIIGVALWGWAFRNPERIPSQKEKNMILAPIDGEITNINEQEKHCIITIKVRFFDSGFVRAPFECKNIKISKKSGLLLYFSNAANNLNEQITIKGAFFEMLLSPKIFESSYYKAESFAIGERMGFMKVGELQINFSKPLDLKVSIGDKILAGQSIVGHLK